MRKVLATTDSNANPSSDRVLKKGVSEGNKRPKCLMKVQIPEFYQQAL